MKPQGCVICRGPRRADGSAVADPFYIGSAGQCYECHLASLLPAALANLEGECPPTGVDLLDLPAGPRLSNTSQIAKGKPR